MKKITKSLSKLTKSILALLMIVSQFFLPIEVLAEELDDQVISTINEQELILDEEELITTEEQDLNALENEEVVILENSEITLDNQDIILEENQDQTLEDNLVQTNIEEQDEILDEQPQITNYKIYINETEQTEDIFNIEDETLKLIKIKSEYTGEENYTYNPIDIIQIDFTNRLYGSYSYELSVSNEESILASKNITINYLGDNNSIINTNNIYYYNNTYYIIGDITKSLTVEEIINKFNPNISSYNGVLEVYDTEDNLLLNTDEVLDGYKLKLSATYTDSTLDNTINEEYIINIVEDSNEDGVIDNKDLQIILLEESLDNIDDTKESLNVVDLTNILIDNPTEESLDNLISTFEYNKSIFLDEEVIINYYLEGFEFDVLKGIEGIINYDKNILELTSIEINSSIGGFNEEGRFIYLLDDYKENGLFMTFKFKPLQVGNTIITIDNITGGTGTIKGANLDTNSFEAEISILERGIGGDVDNNEDEEVDNSQEEEKEETTTQTLVTTQSNNYYAKPILLSGDNFIKTLKIKGYEINFDKDVLEYEIKVKNKVKNLDLEIELNNANAKYEVLGNSDFKEGLNTVTITVTAENGNERTYTIKVNKESEDVIEEETEEENKTSNSSKAIIIFLIILVIIGLVYIIFKDDEEDEK